jgi:hypothetical protein
MATTTNYGWTTPDDTALVKDGAAAIRTLGSSVDTTTKALNPSTTLGDIEYRSSTANTNTRLGIGTTGQILTVAGGVPSWAAPAGGGAMTLVKRATFTTATDSGSSFDSILTSTYQYYLMVLENMTGSNSGSNLQLQVKIGASAQTGSNYRSSFNGFNFAGTTFSVYSNALARFDLPQINDSTAESLNGTLWWTYVGSGSDNPIFNGTIFASHQAAFFGGGKYSAAINYDGFKFMVSAGTFTGSISIYGLVKS